MTSNGSHGNEEPIPPSWKALGEALIRNAREPAFLLDQGAQFLAVNEEGRPLVRTVVYRGSAGGPHFSDQKVNSVFQWLMKRLFEPTAQGLQRKRVGTLLLMLSRYRDSEGQVVPGYAILVVHEVPRKPRHSPGELAEILDLTPMQAEVVYWLMSGRKLAGFAGVAHIGKRTARFQLDSCFEKLGCSSQVELVSQVMWLLRTA